MDKLNNTGPSLNPRGAAGTRLQPDCAADHKPLRTAVQLFIYPAIYRAPPPGLFVYANETSEVYLKYYRFFKYVPNAELLKT